MIEKFDKENGYCPKLGHHLNFEYCRTERGGAPCQKIFNCWFEKFDINTYMKQHFEEIDCSRETSTVPNKMLTLLELIQKAQTRQQEKETV